MLGEDVEYEQLCQLHRGDHIEGQDEDSLLGEMVNND